jgi:4-amino-4-deoxy-L-arabinose transferase-like glycosyltransferase
MKSTHFESFVTIAFILLMVALIGSIIILSWVPPVSRDALTHHLAVPKLYLKHGGIYEIPSIVFSYYPMNLDLLYIIPLYFGNDIAPKLIHFVFALLTAWLIYSYLAKRLGAIWAYLGALFFLSLPIIVKLSITVYVDLGLVFFSTGSILSILKWIESRFQVRFLILAAVSCGLALGTKYNGLMVFFILAVFIPLVFIRGSRNTAAESNPPKKPRLAKVQLKAIGFGAIFCSVALVVFSPWMIRNYIWKSNPIYPLYKNVFRVPEPIKGNKFAGIFVHTHNEGKPFKLKKTTPRWSSFALRKHVYAESWWEIALIPVRIFFQGRDDNPKYFDGKLNPFLFLLPFFAFYRSSADSLTIKSEKRLFVFFSILYLLYAFSQTDMRIRYIAPILPPLVILATYGLHRISKIVPKSRPNSRRWFLAGSMLFLLIFTLSLNATYIVKQFQFVRPFSYLLGRSDRDAYISKYRPEHAVLQYVNRNLSDKAKILALFLGKRRYYSDRELIFGNNLFRKIVKKAGSSDKIRADLQSNEFTHLLIRYDLFNRWSAAQFSGAEKGILKVFFKNNLNQLYSKSGYGLFQLTSVQ